MNEISAKGLNTNSSVDADKFLGTGVSSDRELILKNNLSKNKSFFLTLKTLIQEVKSTFKTSGFKGVVKKYGWKIFAVFFAYYLIRDITIYILIPYLIVKGIS